MRPTRPLRFPRLLFIPFNTLIVEGTEWQPSDPTLPRPTLVPIANTVRAGMGDRAAEIDALIEGGSADDAALVEGVGDMLWPAAAAILAKTPEPVGWERTGMPLSTYQELALTIALVMQRIPALRTFCARYRGGLLERDSESLPQLCEGFETLPETVRVMVMTLAMSEIPNVCLLLDRTPLPGDNYPERSASIILSGWRAGGGRA